MSDLLHYRPRRFHDQKDPIGAPWEAKNVQVPFAAIYEIRQLESGLWVHDAASKKSIGPEGGGVCWPYEEASNRRVSQWNDAFPAGVEDFPDDSGKGGLKTTSRDAPGTKGAEAHKLRPAHEVDKAGWVLNDNDKGKLGALGATTWNAQKFPKKFPGVVVSATDLSSEQYTFVPAGGVLVAPKAHGPGSVSSWVFDLNDKKELDTSRKAPLNTVFRVLQSPGAEYGEAGQYGVALNIGGTMWPDQGKDKLIGALIADDASGGGSGGLATFSGGGSQFFGSLSHRMNGPLRVFGCAKHEHGKNAEGEKAGAIHLGSGSFWHVSDRMDAPMKHSGEVLDFEQGSGKIVEVYWQYYDKASHKTIRGDKKGMQLWTVPQPVYPVKEKPPTEGGGGGGEIPPPPTDGPTEGGGGDPGGGDPGGGTTDGGNGTLENPGQGFDESFRVGLDGTARTSESVPQWNAPVEMFVPGIGFKPVHSSAINPDLRHATGAWGNSTTAFYDRGTPTVMHIEAAGAQDGDGWDNTFQDGAGRYPGGTATGTAWVMPPEFGLERVWQDNVPALYSTPTLGFAFGAQLGFGTPITSGGVGSGMVFSFQSGNLLIQNTSTTGEVTSTAVTITSTGINMPTGLLADRPAASSMGQFYGATNPCATGGGIYVVTDC